MPAILKIPIKFGAIGAAIFALIFIVYFFLGSNALIETEIVNIFILPIFLFFGIKEFRDSYNDRLLKYWQGMTAGFFIYGVFSVLAALFVWTFINIDPSILDGYVQHHLIELEGNKDTLVNEFNQEKYDVLVSDMKNTTARVIAIDDLLRRLGTGLLMTSIISLVMRKKSPN